jgi:NTE family protein
MIRGLGTRDAPTPEFLSLLLFQPDYLQALIQLGEADAARNAPLIDAFLRRNTLSANPAIARQVASS